ncbi:hypothetical protein [Psychromicrobium sp. YIM B11713]|uniref:hypothetical protein n=1 Tax=Psychromicrobium sp. YIM B11713 TaxID=3145233 RepID=UPI00374FD840
MGVFGDILRLMKAGQQQRHNTDWRENLRQSADLSEQLAAQPAVNHGISAANPFAAMTLYAGMLQGSGTVLALHRTSQDLLGSPIYTVELELSFPGQPNYRASYQTMIAEAALHNWKVGAKLPFRVSPDDPNALMLG